MMMERYNDKLLELIKARFSDADGNPVGRGFRQWMQSTGFYKRYCQRRKEAYNKVFQLACKKWPNVVDELIVDIDGWEWIKPCKWGDVDGEAIHDKYWKKIQ